MRLPNEILLTVLEYVAEPGPFRNDPWLWRIRLAGKQFDDLASSLIWKELVMVHALPPLCRFHQLPCLYPHEIYSSGDAREKYSSAKDMIRQEMNYAYGPCLPDANICRKVQHAVQTFRPNYAFEITHNTWSACIYPEKYPACRRLFEHASLLSDEAFDELYDALCSEFTGHLTLLDSGYYTSSITAERAQSQDTFGIVKRHAHHVQSVSFPYGSDFAKMSDDQRSLLLPLLRLISENCNLSSIELITRAKDLLEPLQLFKSHPISSIALTCVNMFNLPQDSWDWIHRIASVMGEYKFGPPELDLELKFPDGYQTRTVFHLPSLRAYSDSGHREIEWLQSSFDLCRALQSVRLVIYSPSKNHLGESLNLPLTVKKLRVHVFPQVEGGATISVTGEGVSNFSLTGEHSLDGEPLVSSLNFDFPALEKFAVQQSYYHYHTLRDFPERFKFGKLKYLELLICPIVQISELVEFLKPTETLCISNLPLVEIYSFNRNRYRDALLKIIEHAPPTIILSYQPTVWRLAKKLLTFPRVKEVYVFSQGRSMEDDAENWLEMWPGDKYKPGQKFRIKRPEAIPTACPIDGLHLFSALDDI